MAYILPCGHGVTSFFNLSCFLSSWHLSLSFHPFPCTQSDFPASYIIPGFRPNRLYLSTNDSKTNTAHRKTTPQPLPFSFLHILEIDNFMPRLAWTMLDTCRMPAKMTGRKHVSYWLSPNCVSGITRICVLIEIAGPDLRTAGSWGTPSTVHLEQVPSCSWPMM